MSVQLPKGYKQTEVGVIPEDWELSALEKLTDPNRPISYGIVQTGPNVLNGIKCLRVVDIDNGKIKKENLITTTKEISDSYKRTILKNGDLVIPLRGKVGEVGLIEEDLEGSNLTRGVGLIALRKNFDSLFFKQNIASIESRGRLEQSMNGSALQEIPIATLRAFKIAYPKEIVEQQAIAEALSDADALIESLEQLIAKKRQIKQGAMQELLTGQRRLLGFSGEWGSVRLLDLVDLHKNQINPAYLPDVLFTHFSLPAFDEGKNPVVENGVDIGSNKFTLPKNSVLLSKLNPRIPRIWAPEEIPENSISSTEFLVLMPKKGTDRRFLKYLCSSNQVCEQMELHATGTTGSHQRISPAQAMLIEISVPLDYSEQRAIGGLFDDADCEISALESRLRKALNIKQSMMQELLTGRIRLI